MFLPDVLQQQQHTQPASMPTPTSNWNMESMPWKIRKADHTGDVMEFTAHAQHRALLHQKRKSDIISPPL